MNHIKTVSMVAFSASILYLAATPIPTFGQIAVATAVGAGVAVAWSVIGYVGSLLTRPVNNALFLDPVEDADVIALMAGACPSCKKKGSITEVTSGNGHSVVRCLLCTEAYDARIGDGGKPVVIRLGKQ